MHLSLPTISACAFVEILLKYLNLFKFGKIVKFFFQLADGSVQQQTGKEHSCAFYIYAGTL